MRRHSHLQAYIASYQGLPSGCWRGFFLSFINTVSGGVTFFLSLYFVKILHMNIATAGLIISSYGFGTALGGVVGGRVSDRFSPFVVLSISLILKAFGFLMLIFLNTPFPLMLNLLMVGVATYSFKTANTAWVLNQCDAHVSARLKAINILHVASNLGIGCSAVIVSYFTSHRFHSLFFLAAFLLIAAVSYQVVSARAQSKRIFLKNEGLKKDDVSIPGVLSKNKSFLMWIALATLFLVGLVIAQLSTTYSIYLHDAFPSLGIHAVTSLFVLNCLLIIFFQAPLVNFLGQYNKILVMGLGALLVGFGMFALSIAFYFFIAVLSALVYTVGEMMFFATAQLVCYEQGMPHKKGQSLGLYQSMYAASTTAGPAIGGFIYHYFGGCVVWYAAGIVGLVCFVPCYFLRSYG